MRTGSKQLWQYLAEAGVLDGPEPAIEQAKRAYRKHYKQEWKRKKYKKKELRPLFTRQEFEAISTRANLFGLNPTAYAKELILTAQGHTDLIPRKNELLQVLQAVSVAQNSIMQNTGNNEAHTLLSDAETRLIKYLKQKEYGA